MSSHARLLSLVERCAPVPNRSGIWWRRAAVGLIN